MISAVTVVPVTGATVHPEGRVLGRARRQLALDQGEVDEVDVTAQGQAPTRERCSRARRVTALGKTRAQLEVWISPSSVRAGEIEMHTSPSPSAGASRTGRQANTTCPFASVGAVTVLVPLESS